MIGIFFIQIFHYFKYTLIYDKRYNICIYFDVCNISITIHLHLNIFSMFLYKSETDGISSLYTFIYIYRI